MTWKNFGQLVFPLSSRADSQTFSEVPTRRSSAVRRMGFLWLSSVADETSSVADGQLTAKKPQHSMTISEYEEALIHVSKYCFEAIRPQSLRVMRSRRSRRISQKSEVPGLLATFIASFLTISEAKETSTAISQKAGSNRLARYRFSASGPDDTSIISLGWSHMTTSLIVATQSPRWQLCIVSEPGSICNSFTVGTMCSHHGGRLCLQLPSAIPVDFGLRIADTPRTAIFNSINEQLVPSQQAKNFRALLILSTALRHK